MITTINEWKKYKLNEYRDNEHSLNNSLEYYKVNGWEDIRDYLANKTSGTPGYSDDWDEVKEHIDIINNGFVPRSTIAGVNLIVYRKTNTEDLTKHIGFISTTENEELLNDEDFIAFNKKYINVIELEKTALIIDLDDVEYELGDSREEEILLSPKNTFELVKREGDTLYYKAFYR